MGIQNSESYILYHVCKCFLKAKYEKQTLRACVLIEIVTCKINFIRDSVLESIAIGRHQTCHHLCVCVCVSITAHQLSPLPEYIHTPIHTACKHLSP